MLTMTIFKTNSSEARLFLCLVGRGRCADTPYYQSVESYVIEDGTVIFCRLDCAPAQPHKVGIAGNQVFTSESFAGNIEQWLLGWDIKFTCEREQFVSQEAARKFFSQMRQETKQGRDAVLQTIQGELRAQGKTDDLEMRDVTALPRERL